MEAIPYVTKWLRCAKSVVGITRCSPPGARLVSPTLEPLRYSTLQVSPWWAICASFRKRVRPRQTSAGDGRQRATWCPDGVPVTTECDFPAPPDAR